MNLFDEYVRYETRRQFFGRGRQRRRLRRRWRRCSAEAAAARRHRAGQRGALPETHFPAKAKHVIYLHMVGGPSQMDLFDYKPEMSEWYDKDLPESIRKGQRLTTMTSGQARFPIAPSKYKFAQHGKCGMWISELLPYTAKMVDDMCFIRRMHTEAINHEPAITLHADRQPGHRPAVPRARGRRYGLGSLNQNLPTFVVLVAKPTQHRAGAGDLGPAVVSRLPARRARRRVASAPAAIRSCTSTTRPACPPTSAARRSTASRRSTS